MEFKYEKKKNTLHVTVCNISLAFLVLFGSSHIKGPLLFSVLMDLSCLLGPKSYCTGKWRSTVDGILAWSWPLSCETLVAPDCGSQLDQKLPNFHLAPWWTGRCSTPLQVHWGGRWTSARTPALIQTLTCDRWAPAPPTYWAWSSRSGHWCSHILSLTVWL